jgi:hypothetical protein
MRKPLAAFAGTVWRMVRHGWCALFHRRFAWQDSSWPTFDTRGDYFDVTCFKCERHWHRPYVPNAPRQF